MNRSWQRDDRYVPVPVLDQDPAEPPMVFARRPGQPPDIKERRRKLTTEAKIRSIACPRCSAPIAMDCHSERWNRVDFHVARKRAVGM